MVVIKLETFMVEPHFGCFDEAPAMAAPARPNSRTLGRRPATILCRTEDLGVFRNGRDHARGTLATP